MLSNLHPENQGYENLKSLSINNEGEDQLEVK